jgi:hypothetical protein
MEGVDEDYYSVNKSISMEEVGFTAGHPAACEFDVNSIESQRI